MHEGGNCNAAGGPFEFGVDGPESNVNLSLFTVCDVGRLLWSWKRVLLDDRIIGSTFEDGRKVPPGTCDIDNVNDYIINGVSMIIAYDIIILLSIVFEFCGEITSACGAALRVLQLS